MQPLRRDAYPSSSRRILYSPSCSTSIYALNGAKSPERGTSEVDGFTTVSEGQSLEEEGVHIETEVNESEQLGMEPEEEDEPAPPPPPRPANQPPPVPRSHPLVPGSRQSSVDVGAAQSQGFTVVEAPDSDAEGGPPLK